MPFRLIGVTQPSFHPRLFALLRLKGAAASDREMQGARSSPAAGQAAAFASRPCRHAAAAAAPPPLACARRSRRCSALVACAAERACPVGMGSVAAGPHTVEPPTGLPNTRLRPVSDLAVSSSKALEAFRASGAANRARPLEISCCQELLMARTDAAPALARLRVGAEEQHRGAWPVHPQHAGGGAREARHPGGTVACSHRRALLLPARGGGGGAVHVQPHGDLLRGPLVQPRRARGGGVPGKGTSPLWVPRPAGALASPAATQPACRLELACCAALPCAGARLRGVR